MSFERGTELEYYWVKLTRQMEAGQSKHLRHVPVNPLDKKALSDAKDVMNILAVRTFGPYTNGELPETYNVVACHRCGNILDHQLRIIKTVYLSNGRGKIHTYACRSADFCKELPRL